MTGFFRGGPRLTSARAKAQPGAGAPQEAIGAGAPEEAIKSLPAAAQERRDESRSDARNANHSGAGSLETISDLVSMLEQGRLPPTDVATEIWTSAKLSDLTPLVNASRRFASTEFSKRVLVELEHRLQSTPDSPPWMQSGIGAGLWAECAALAEVHDNQPLHSLWRSYSRALVYDGGHFRDVITNHNKPLSSEPTMVAPIAARTERYELISELGRGGSSNVYLALDRNTGRQVAYKKNRQGGARGGANQRLELELEATVPVALAHDNIVRIFEYDLDTGAVVMELGCGSLRAAELIDIKTEQLFLWAFQLSRAVAHVHQNGWIHGDIKPSNVLRRKNGTVCLADFGCAQRLTENAPGIRGTRQYLAPEVLSDLRQTAASDVFALGITIGEFLPRLEGDDWVKRATDKDPALRPSAIELQGRIGALLS